jgi:uncharacterized protein YqjF (DUF2071 family)
MPNAAVPSVHKQPTSGPWVMAMEWRDLLFAHWPVPAAALRGLIPPTLELQTFDGYAWLGVVPFRMSNVRPRMVPAVPWLSHFAELNVRTYVTAGGKPGVWFFSLDATNPIAVRLARATFHLPYFDARIQCQEQGDTVHYRSIRTHRNTPEAALIISYRPTGPVYHSQPGSLEYWLTERYYLYAANQHGHILRGGIRHVHWPLQPAEAEFQTNEMTFQIGLRSPTTQPLLHFARYIDVVAWLPERVTS